MGLCWSAAGNVNTNAGTNGATRNPRIARSRSLSLRKESILFPIHAASSALVSRSACRGGRATGGVPACPHCECARRQDAVPANRVRIESSYLTRKRNHVRRGCTATCGHVKAPLAPNIGNSEASHSGRRVPHAGTACRNCAPIVPSGKLDLGLTSKGGNSGCALPRRRARCSHLARARSVDPVPASREGDSYPASRGQAPGRRYFCPVGLQLLAESCAGYFPCVPSADADPLGVPSGKLNEDDLFDGRRVLLEQRQGARGARDGSSCRRLRMLTR